MNPTILSLLFLMLVVACVECQQGEECSRRCTENEYCRKGFIMNMCMVYREKGMPCSRRDRCRPGLECRAQRDSFFGISRCQDPATTSTTRITSMPTSTSMPDTTMTM